MSESGKAAVPVQTCSFCYRQCRLSDGQTGPCGVRKACRGRLETVVYGHVAAAGVDPIEKKPLFHVYPGSRTLSVALPGCNFSCSFCQNHTLSRYSAEGGTRYRYTSPRELVAMLDANELTIMTYTYSDPVVWQDYMLDTARLVKAWGGVNCMVTNGSMSSKATGTMEGLIDAFNIDVKGSEEFYRTYCGGSLHPVIRNVREIIRSDRSVVEVTTLVIEDIHTIEDILELGSLLADAGVQVWHLSRFFPAYRMLEYAATSESFLHRALEAAAESGIPHIYSGNSRDTDYAATYCTQCHTELIPSHSYGGEAAEAVSRTLQSGHCRACGEPLYGLF